MAAIWIEGRSGSLVDVTVQGPLPRCNLRIELRHPFMSIVTCLVAKIATGNRQLKLTNQIFMLNHL